MTTDGFSTVSTRTVWEKARSAFGDLVIDKRRLPASKLTGKGIPAYVAEWVLSEIVPGEGPLTIEEGQRLLAWARQKMPSTEEGPVLRKDIALGSVVKVLTFVEADVRLKKDKEAETFAKFPLIGIEQAQIPRSILDQYPELLKQGMWGIATIEGGKLGTLLASFKPMQSTVDLSLYKEVRREFSTEEWMALLINSIGLDPMHLTVEQQLLMLGRLLPLAQQNMHLIELAPKGTGKSFLYENLSPKVRLVSSGSISPAVLFVNNATGQWGVLARFKVVVLDEVQTVRLSNTSEIVGGLKGYLANGKLTRGGKLETGSDCSLVLLANIELNENFEPVRLSLVEELPEPFRETAFLDRFRGILPGWKLPKLEAGSFSKSLGLKADYFADVLCALRDDLEFDQNVSARVRLLGPNAYKRNEDSVRTIATGYAKLLFPHGDYSPSDLEEFCVRPALEMRQLIWEELQRADREYLKYGSTLEAKVD